MGADALQSLTRGIKESIQTLALVEPGVVQEARSHLIGLTHEQVTHVAGVRSALVSLDGVDLIFLRS